MRRLHPTATFRHWSKARRARRGAPRRHEWTQSMPRPRPTRRRTQIPAPRNPDPHDYSKALTFAATTRYGRVPAAHVGADGIELGEDAGGRADAGQAQRVLRLRGADAHRGGADRAA